MDREPEAGQQMCLSEAVKYDPPDAKIEGKLFFTWGYDIGVAVWRIASLNLAHRSFREDRAEIWYYCIHELHHTLVMKNYPMPRLADVKDTRQFLELVQYLTFLEGRADGLLRSLPERNICTPRLTGVRFWSLGHQRALSASTSSSVNIAWNWGSSRRSA